MLAAFVLTGQVAAKIHKFHPNQPGMRNLGVWRLTYDPAVSDFANYHNIQCWSHDGRYTCYTHSDGSKDAGRKPLAQVHVVDLSTGEDRRVARGLSPRWANNHNWLFCYHWPPDSTPPYETSGQVIRYDADTGEKVVITHGMGGIGGLDATDTWLYGVRVQLYRKPTRKVILTTMRVRNRPNSKLEVIKGAPNTHPYIHVNPRYPVIMTRARNKKDKIYGINRAFFDLDGSNLRKGSVMAERGHQSWSGDGKYLLLGNRQICGRSWNKPFPSDLDVLARGMSSDISPCGKSGRYISGNTNYLIFADTRSGDQWPVLCPRSYRIYPMEGDYSGLSDVDPKGSPDGTKIHYHSTCDIENLPVATITQYDERKQPDVIHVDSTKGFPESGDLVRRWEVIGYRKKTAATFEGITRQKYGTRKALRTVPLGSWKPPALLPLSAYVLPEKDKARARPDVHMLRAGFPKSHPLIYQRATDCYIAVTRLPSRPHLRLRKGKIELIPGESHWETRGYRILRNGRPIGKKLLMPGQSFTLPGPGAYTAAAVEWSGLESQPSLPLQIRTSTNGRILKDVPRDFSWTREVWKVGGKTVSRGQAMKASAAAMELVHLHDGIIARETWRAGRKVLHVDLNEQGKPIRHLEFENGKLKKRLYKTPEGVPRSEEFFGPDGFKTEYVCYYTRPDRRGTEWSHWWYDHGRPIKRTSRGRVVFDVTGKGG